MAGLKDKRGFIDKDRLDLSERKAVEFWMKRWGVTQDQLTAAHRKVGRATSRSRGASTRPIMDTVSRWNRSRSVSTGAVRSRARS